jgi:hypothetical protein
MFESSNKPTVFKNLMFGLAFFNAVIQERRKYGAVGWNIPYQWMTSDLVCAQQNLHIYIDEQPETPYEVREPRAAREAVRPTSSRLLEPRQLTILARRSPRLRCRRR